jgi:DNA-binding beta-propeller fold protein YncE
MRNFRATLIALWLARILIPGLSAQTVITVQEGLGTVVLCNAPCRDSSRRATIKVGEKPHEVEVAPDGRTAYVSNFGLLEGNHKTGTPGNSISVIDVNRRVETGRLTLPSGFTAPHGLKLRPPEYDELFTNAEEGTSGMVVFSRKSAAVLRTFPLPSGVHNFVFNSDGSALFAFTIAGEVLRVDPAHGNVTARMTAGSPRGLGWTADRRHLIVAGTSEILLLDPERLGIEKRFGNLGVGQTYYPAATPDGRWILVPAVLDGVVVVVDAATGSVARRVETGSPLLLAFADGGKQAWVSNVLVPAGVFGPDVKPKPGGVMLLDLTTFKTTAIEGIPDANGLALAPAGP